MTPSATKPTRSWLFTPGTRPDRFAKAADAGADVLIIDLEDAVAPDDKPKARSAAIDHLSGPAGSGISRALRINGLDTAAGIADLHALLASDARPDFLVLPKADGPGHLHILDRLLAAKGLDTRLVGLVESVVPGVEAPRLGGGIGHRFADDADCPRRTRIICGGVGRCGHALATRPCLHGRSCLPCQIGATARKAW